MLCTSQASRFGAKNKREKLVTQLHLNGYQVVGISINKKRRMFYVHRLVAELFVTNKEGCRFVITSMQMLEITMHQTSDGFQITHKMRGILSQLPKG